MRGFAQTVHCPRCGTAKPTGGDVAPIVTCVACGLGFDPKPREHRRPATALVRVESASLVREETSDTEALLSVRDSVWMGIWELLVAAGVLWFVSATYGTLWWGYIAIFAALSAFAIYAGLARTLNRIFVHVTPHALDAWSRPLPRRRLRALAADDITAITIVPRPSTTYDVLVDGVLLVNVPHEALAVELVLAIEKHRARLGAPVLTSLEDQAAATAATTRVERRET